MAGEDGRRGRVAVIIALVVALVVVLVMWQRDRASRDVEIEIDTGDTGALAQPVPALAVAAPGGRRATGVRSS